MLQTLHTLKDLLPTTHVVLLALLPRGSTWNDYTWPSLYTQPMQMVNAHFRRGRRAAVWRRKNAGCAGVGVGARSARAAAASRSCRHPPTPTPPGPPSPPSSSLLLFPSSPPLRDYAALDGHLHFLDCGDRFLAPDRRAISAALMPDGLHPNAAGHELLAQCLDPLVTKLMQRGAKEGGQGAEGALAGGRDDVATLAVGTQ